MTWLYVSGSGLLISNLRLEFLFKLNNKTKETIIVTLFGFLIVITVRFYDSLPRFFLALFLIEKTYQTRKTWFVHI